MNNIKEYSEQDEKEVPNKFIYSNKEEVNFNKVKDDL